MQQHSYQPNISWEDFSIEFKLGEGTYGYVFLASRNAQEYALKEMSKYKLKHQHSQHLPLVERQILKSVTHPGIVKSHFFFQTQSKFYIGLELCEGGRFQDIIIRKSIDQKARRFYFAELVNTLEYLHTNGIVHRDLKPSNLMLTHDSHLKIIDFGNACIQNSRLISQIFKEKLNNLKGNRVEFKGEQKWQECVVACGKIRRRKSSFVGTSLYVSPQLLEVNQCNAPADLWTLGCLLYYLYYGESPFADVSEFKVYQRIRAVKFSFPPNQELNEEAKDLIMRLLVKDPSQRLGSCSKYELSFQALKQHPYLASINVDSIYQKQPPVVETPARQLNRQLHQIRTLYMANHQEITADTFLEQILIRNTQDEDTISKLVIRRDGSLEIFQFAGDWPEKGQIFKLARCQNKKMTTVLSKKKISIRVQGGDLLIFTTLQPQVLSELIDNYFSGQLDKAQRSPD